MQVSNDSGNRRQMSALNPLISAFVALWPLFLYQRDEPKKLSKEPVDSTVCEILRQPFVYNNKLVRVRGYLEVNFEYSLLINENCSDEGIWFVFADGSGPPGLQITVKGHGIPGSKNSKGRLSPPIPVRLVKDANFEELERFLETSAKAESYTDEPPRSALPNCTAYRVTATFTGRIDSVSRKIHEARLKQSSSQAVDGKGFGHMGLFEAELVAQSVENVVAVDKSEIHKSACPHSLYATEAGRSKSYREWPGRGRQWPREDSRGVGEKTHRRGERKQRPLWHLQGCQDPKKRRP